MRWTALWVKAELDYCINLSDQVRQAVGISGLTSIEQADSSMRILPVITGASLLPDISKRYQLVSWLCKSVFLTTWRVFVEIALHTALSVNVHNIAGHTTRCPVCKSDLIERDWYEIKQYRLTPDGRCPDCHAAIAGHFENFTKAYGRHRIKVMPS